MLGVWPEVEHSPERNASPPFTNWRSSLALEVGWAGRAELLAETGGPTCLPSTLLAVMGTLEGSWRVITLGRRWAHKLIFQGLQGAATSIPDKCGTLALLSLGCKVKPDFFF